MLLSLGLAPCLLSACLVPIPLSAETSDGGQILQVTGATPPFGTQFAQNKDTPFFYEVDVKSDSPTLAARLFLQVNGTCCQLNISDSTVTQFRQYANPPFLDSTMGTVGQYTINFPSPVQPCQQAQPGTEIFVVPVLATQGFSSTDGPTSANGLGAVDSSHYWTVSCP
jgi:hypothetical protein